MNDSTYLTENLAKNETLVNYLIKQVVSEPISKIKPIGNAKTSFVYEVNNHLIVKFPSCRTDTSNWKMQSENAPVLQSSFSFQIPQPKLKAVVLTSTSPRAMLSAYYEKIKGRTITSGDFAERPIEFKQRFFEQLSDAAVQIHAICPDTLPVPPLKSEELAKSLLPIRPDNHFFNGLVRLLMYFPGVGFERPPQRILCHSDLHSSNICLDEKDNLIGILDFDTLNQGNYFAEFRPFLYRKKEDIEMFRKIYEKRSGRTMSDRDIRWMDMMYKVMCVSAATARIKRVATFKNPVQKKGLSRDCRFF